MRQKQVHGFQTGDTVRANVPTAKKAPSSTGFFISFCFLFRYSTNKGF